MVEETTDLSIQQASEEVKLTQGDLARSWLGHKGANIHREIASTENSLEFNRNYQPKPLGKRPSYTYGPGAGGGDVADWEAEEGAYNQWPEEQEELIENGEKRLKNLEGQEETLNRKVDLVNKGDTRLIEKYARLETERRAILKKKREKGILV